MRIDTATRLCAVIGNPVVHSLSPAMHNAAFEALGLNYVYVAFHVEDVGACLSGMRALPSFRGMSVTIPHKMAVMPHLDEIEVLAQHVGCVNTVINENGRLLGANTDGLGTLRAFEEAGVSLAGRRILFLGAGGAVRAVAFAMAEQGGAETVTLLARNPAKAAALADDLRAGTPAHIATGDLEADLAAAMAAHDIIVQGTPIGMYPERVGQTCVPPELLQSRHVVFDMVYNPMKTRFLLDAEAKGCVCILGGEMLLQQAVLQFERWTGQAAPVGIMRAALLGALQERQSKNNPVGGKEAS